jgi:hypothetical protein
MGTRVDGTVKWTSGHLQAWGVLMTCLIVLLSSCRKRPPGPEPSEPNVSSASAPSPPDLSQCTRLEIRFRPSTLHEIGLAQRLLNQEETEYVLSLDPIVCENREAIRAFARELLAATYVGPRMPSVRVKGHALVTCYSGGAEMTSFQARATFVAFDGGHAFEREGIYSYLQKMSGPLAPFRLRGACADRLRYLWSKLDVIVRRNESYPAPSEWCDAIYWTPHCRTYYWFRCPGAGAGDCHYAMNPQCKPDSPDDVVLLFEAKPGWNQHGGPELFTFDNHDPGGGCVLLKGGTLKFIRTEDELYALRWR